MRINRAIFAAKQAELSLSVNELAVLTGLSRGTVTAVRGGKSCSVDTAKKLVSVLGKDILKTPVNGATDTDVGLVE